MGITRRKRKARRAAWVTFTVAALVVAWFSGLAGWSMVRLMSRFMLPRDLGDETRLESLVFSLPRERRDRMAELTIRPERLRQIALKAAPWTRFLPPGIIQHGMCLSATWRPEDPPLPSGMPLPIYLRIDATAPEQPRLVGRFPVQSFNALLQQHAEEKLATKEEYFLGHYELIQTPTFNTISIRSETNAPPDSIDVRRLYIEATGTIRVAVKDGILAARITGKVKRLSGVCTLELIRDDDGIGIRHAVVVDAFDLSAKNMAPWAENALADELKQSMVRSLNKEKKRKKLSRHRAPHWVPVDMTLDLELVP